MATGERAGSDLAGCFEGGRRRSAAHPSLSPGSRTPVVVHWMLRISPHSRRMVFRGAAPAEAEACTPRIGSAYRDHDLDPGASVGGPPGSARPRRGWLPDPAGAGVEHGRLFADDLAPSETAVVRARGEHVGALAVEPSRHSAHHQLLRRRSARPHRPAGPGRVEQGGHVVAKPVVLVPKQWSS